MKTQGPSDLFIMQIANQARKHRKPAQCLHFQASSRIKLYPNYIQKAIAMLMIQQWPWRPSLSHMPSPMAPPCDPQHWLHIGITWEALNTTDAWIPSQTFRFNWIRVHHGHWNFLNSPNVFQSAVKFDDHSPSDSITSLALVFFFSFSFFFLWYWWVSFFFSFLFIYLFFLVRKIVLELISFANLPLFVFSPQRPST